MNSFNLLSLLAMQTWQVAIVALMVWIVARIFCKNRSRVAHALWALVLLKCLTPPLWSSPTGLFSWAPIVPTKMSLPESSAFDEPLRGEELKAHSTLSVRIDEGAFGSTPLSKRNLKATSISNPIRITTWDRLQDSSIALWGLGAGLIATISIARFLAFWLWMKKHELVVCETSPIDMKAKEELDRLLVDLRKKFKIKRAVRLRLVNAPVGPAIVGLFRPTIVLPRAITEGKESSDLAPLMAHELIHVRRGDLIWSLLQTLSTSLLWFHPMVWIAGRKLTQESERSCDLETIASLGCSPASYARCLVDVLERKHLLRVAPALPGVRPVDITRDRLERIMRLGQGCQKQNRWWTFLILIAGSLLVLPGASLSVAQQTEAQKSSTIPLIYASPAEAIQKGEVQAPKQANHEPASLQLREYEVADLRPKILEQGIAEAAADGYLIEQLKPILSPPIPNTKYFMEFGLEKHGVVMMSQSDPIKIFGTTLYAYGTEEDLRKIERELQIKKKYGFDEISVHTSFLTISRQLFDQLELGWKRAEPSSVEWNNESEGMVKNDDVVVLAQNPKVEPYTVKDNPRPTFYSVLTERDIAGIRSKVTAVPTTNLLQSPRVTVHAGQQASVADIRKHPFCVDVKNGATTIAVVESGRRLNFQATLNQAGGFNVDLKLKESEIREVLEFEYKQMTKSKDDANTHVQWPDVMSRSYSGNFHLQEGETIMIMGPISAKKENEQQVNIVLLSVQKIKKEKGVAQDTLNSLPVAIDFAFPISYAVDAFSALFKDVRESEPGTEPQLCVLSGTSKELVLAKGFTVTRVHDEAIVSVEVTEDNRARLVALQSGETQVDVEYLNSIKKSLKVVVEGIPAEYKESLQVTPDGVQAKYELRVFRLRYASSKELQKIIEQKIHEGASEMESIDHELTAIVSKPEINALIVRALTKDMARIATLIKSLDVKGK